MIEPLGGVVLDVKAAWELARDGDLAAKHTYCIAINHSKVFFIFFSINNLFFEFFWLYKSISFKRVLFVFSIFKSSNFQIFELCNIQLTASAYPSVPCPIILCAHTSVSILTCRNASRFRISDICTSTTGTSHSSTASRSATLVWLYPPAFSTTPPKSDG